jgi:HD-GYP domain-containing protein (c-di-GMP phosphodiesterase class II)
MAPSYIQEANIQEIPLAELLSALSHALDMAGGEPAGHCVRSCWIGVHIGQEIGLCETGIWELFYTLLLKDLGCSSNAARICRLYLTDDLSFKHDFKLIDGSRAKALRFVLAHTGLKTGLAERLRTIVKVIHNASRIALELTETRCQRGAEIARKMRFPEAVAHGIQNLDEHWDGAGMPARLRGAAIPIYSRIALMAQVIDVVHTGNGVEAARREVRRRSGTWFDPQVAGAFERIALRHEFWDTLRSNDLPQAIYALEPAQQVKTVDEDYLDDIAAAFAKVIDAKCHYTNGRCERVALFADMIADRMGFSAERRRFLKRAALLHDIGKLGVSNAILDKPGKLDPDEWTAMKMHAAHSETILSRIAAFHVLAPIAAAHHERLDGNGYPRGLNGDQIVIETRIITTADVFDALTAYRPYRASIPISRSLAIMSESVGTAIDRNCFDALRYAMGSLDVTLAA